MRISIDISGQIQQKNYNSALGAKRSDGAYRTAYLRSQTKKELIKKYKGQVTRLIEKIHCILIYYYIRDILSGVDELKICKDINPRAVKNFLPLLFKEKLKKIRIKFCEREEKSNGHRPAIRAFRRRKHANELVTKDMIEKLLFKFK